MLYFFLIGGGGGGLGALDSHKIYDLHSSIDVLKPTCNLLPLREMTIMMSHFCADTPLMGQAGRL